MNYPWHQAVWSGLQRARASNRLPHALLFSGDQGCGHEHFTHTVAQNLLCLSPAQDGWACGTCRSCQVYSASAHPDFARVEVAADKQVIGVNQIRALNHFLELSRSYSPVRVAIIHEADKMNINAANSLLKSLEEPAAHTHILLFSSQPSILLPTIRSRCQQIRLPLPEFQTAIQWLSGHHPVQDANTLLKLAKGRPLHALTLDSGELLASQQAWQQHLLDVLESRKTIAAIGSEWSSLSRNQLLDWQLDLVQVLIKYRLGTLESVTEENDRSPLGEILSKKDLWALYDQLLAMKRLSAHPLNKQLFAENMLSLWLK